MSGAVYRHRNGVIEVQWAGDDWWAESAHNSATSDEVAGYEDDAHPAAAALREKFAYLDGPSERQIQDQMNQLPPERMLYVEKDTLGRGGLR